MSSPEDVMGDAVERLEFDERAVGCAGEGSEDEVNALEGELAFFVGEAAAGDVFSEDDGRGRLALDARGEDLLGDHFCAGSGEASDKAGESAFGDAAVWVLRAHGGLDARKHDRPWGEGKASG